jgi:hypothetical protein
VGPVSDQPRKAYYVNEVWRNVSSLLVYADSAEDAKRRVRVSDVENVIGLDLAASAEPRGFESVRRAPADDRPRASEKGGGGS